GVDVSKFGMEMPGLTCELLLAQERLCEKARATPPEDVPPPTPAIRAPKVVRSDSGFAAWVGLVRDKIQPESLLFRWGHQIINNVVGTFYRKPFKGLRLPHVGPRRDGCLNAHFERAVFG